MLLNLWVNFCPASKFLEENSKNVPVEGKTLKTCYLRFNSMERPQPALPGDAVKWDRNSVLVAFLLGLSPRGSDGSAREQISVVAEGK